MTSIRVTAVVDEQRQKTVLGAIPLIEKFLKPLSREQFGGGVDQLVFVLVCSDVSSDIAEDRRSNFDKVGRYKNPASGASVKYISQSVVVDPMIITGLSTMDAAKVFLTEIVKVLKAPRVQFPRGFDMDALRTTLILAENLT